MLFHDRVEAGRRLAAELEGLRGQDVVVLGLPRGGVPVALEVASELDAPLDVIVVRKLGVPFQPELAMGAIGEDGVQVLNDEVLRLTGVSPATVAEIERRERAELERRARRYRGARRRLPLDGRTAVVVDDGIATGSTAMAACRVARAHGAARVVLAVPVGPPDWRRRLAAVADELHCVATPPEFVAVGQFYDDFSAVTDDEVVACLRRGVPRHPTRVVMDGGPLEGDAEVEVDLGDLVLPGHLTIPPAASGIVVFAHGSGSSRHSPRNRYVASALHEAGIATLLFDLLTADEEGDRAKVFDVELLAERLTRATDWVTADPDVAGLPIGYFGASTGAAAALWAASERSGAISAVVSRGGRPDLAGPRLATVGAPTLLIVGSLDTVVLDLNREAQSRLRCESRLVVVPGATHLFEEAGTLGIAASAAREWFTDHFRTSAQRPASAGKR